jgi:hypothetical protein
MFTFTDQTRKTDGDDRSGAEHRNSQAFSPFDVEAPDRGDQVMRREAPERKRSRVAAEAPDAGEGRREDPEHQFTHGRSQS